MALRHKLLDSIHKYDDYILLHSEVSHHILLEDEFEFLLTVNPSTSVFCWFESRLPPINF